MTGITSHAKKGDFEHFCESIKNFAGSVCGLTEASAQVNLIIYSNVVSNLNEQSCHVTIKIIVRVCLRVIYIAM